MIPELPLSGMLPEFIYGIVLLALFAAAVIAAFIYALPFIFPPHKMEEYNKHLSGEADRRRKSIKAVDDL